MKSYWTSLNSHLKEKEIPPLNWWFLAPGKDGWLGQIWDQAGMVDQYHQAVATDDFPIQKATHFWWHR